MYERTITMVSIDKLIILCKQINIATNKLQHALHAMLIGTPD